MVLGNIQGRRLKLKSEGIATVGGATRLSGTDFGGSALSVAAVDCACADQHYQLRRSTARVRGGERGEGGGGVANPQVPRRGGGEQETRRGAGRHTSATGKPPLPPPPPVAAAERSSAAPAAVTRLWEMSTATGPGEACRRARMCVPAMPAEARVCAGGGLNRGACQPQVRGGGSALNRGVC